MPVNDSGIMSFRAAGTVNAYRRVKFSATNAVTSVIQSGATGIDCGVSLYAGATGDMIAVALLNKPGTLEVKGAATAPAYGAILYPAADGKLTATAATGLGIATYVAIRAASATGEVLEVVFRKFHSTATGY